MPYDGIGDGSQRWPFPAGADSGTDVLHAETFATGERTPHSCPSTTSRRPTTSRATTSC